MPYARFDDRWDDHRKIKKALRREPAAVAMHAMAITYSSRHSTDGAIDSEWIDEKLAQMPLTPAKRRLVLRILLELQLFEIVDDETFVVHDFLDWNLSSAQRKTLAEQGRRGGRASKGSSGPGSGGSSHGSSHGSSEGLSRGPSTPFATPTPTPRENYLSDADRVDEKTTGPDPVVVFRLSERLAARVRANDPKAHPDPRSQRWMTDTRLLLQDRGGDEAEVERIIDWCQADSFWRCNILSPAKLRKQFTQLVLKANSAGAATNGNVVHGRFAEFDEAVERKWGVKAADPMNGDTA